jgi:hypothetical protein
MAIQQIEMKQHSSNIELMWKESCTWMVFGRHSKTMKGFTTEEKTCRVIDISQYTQQYTCSV